MATTSTDFLDATGYHRPRRPDPDTITYLRGLPLQDSQQQQVYGDDGGDTTPHQQIQNYLLKMSSAGGNNDSTTLVKANDEVEFPSILAAALSALDEISNEVASLAGDEVGSQSLEMIARLVLPYSELSGRILLHACAGYNLHLATHRYGSHVLQTLLQLAVYQYHHPQNGNARITETTTPDLALHEDAPGFSSTTSTQNIPPLKEIIMSVVEELAPHATQLAVHICGSHVLRTLLCVLGGVDLVPSGPPSKGGGSIESSASLLLRGRPKSKKKKKKKRYDPETGNEISSTTTATTPHAGTMTVVYRPTSRIDPEQFEETLQSLSFSLLGDDEKNGPGELQQLVCHASAGPLYIVLVRVLTYTAKSARQEWLNRTTQQLDNQSDSIADYRLGIVRTEPRYEVGSLADKAVRKILCWQDGNDDKKQDNVGDVVYGLSGETRGSHMLETILRLCPDGFFESIIQYGDFLTPSSLQEYIEHEVSNFVVQTLLSTVRNQDQAATVLKALDGAIASGLVIDSSKKRRSVLWRATELAAKFRIGQKNLLESIRLGFGVATSANIKLKDCVPLLIDVKEGSVLDAAGCRSVHHMLRFSPSLCEPIIDGVINEIPAESLVVMAKDGLGSRCIMDGILDGPILTPIFARASKKLWEKLEGNWASLATDRVGHHTVMKLFKALPKVDDKAKLVDELYNGGNRLRGNAMGRTVIETCQVDLYGENRGEWRRKIVKSLTKPDESFVDTLVSKKSTEEKDTDNEHTKKKRKRNRKKSSQADGEDYDGDDNTEDLVKKQKKGSASQPSSVDSILKIMTSGP
jgi:Pumilio-family RNA binding repeat